jgi:hypothetical protein
VKSLLTFVFHFDRWEQEMDRTTEKLLTLDEFGAIVRMSKDWVGKACRDGQLRHVTMGSGTKRQRRLVYASEADRLLRTRTQESVTVNQELHRIARLRTRRPLPPVEQRY